MNSKYCIPNLFSRVQAERIIPFSFHPVILAPKQTEYGYVGQMLVRGQIVGYPLSRGDGSDPYYKTQEYRDSISCDDRTESKDADEWIPDV